MNDYNKKWEDQSLMLCNRVSKNLKKIKKWLKKENITCYRLYNKDIPEIPLAIDWYEGKLHVAFYKKQNKQNENHNAQDGFNDDESIKAWLDAVVYPLAQMLKVEKELVFIKYKIRGVGGTMYMNKDNSKHLTEVSEDGHKFFINLSSHIDTGLFLDHRLARKIVKSESRGKRFLNLFAYTGAFTVYAAAGGAISTTTVDMSNTYLNFAKANMDLNGFSQEHHFFVKNDVVGALQNRTVKGKYDIIVIDPPTISKSKSMTQNMDIQKDHVWMINRTLEILATDGTVYFSNNYKKFKMDEDNINCGYIKEITYKTVSPDFLTSNPHRCWKLTR